MAESSIFEWLGAALEGRTSLSRIEARGTIRLVLKDAGLDPTIVRPLQMLVVLERLMPAALKKRGVENPEALCKQLANELREQGQQASDTEAETPYDVFERLDHRAPRRPKT